MLYKRQQRDSEFQKSKTGEENHTQRSQFRRWYILQFKVPFPPFPPIKMVLDTSKRHFMLLKRWFLGGNKITTKKKRKVMRVTVLSFMTQCKLFSEGLVKALVTSLGTIMASLSRLPNKAPFYKQCDCERWLSVSVLLCHCLQWRFSESPGSCNGSSWCAKLTLTSQWISMASPRPQLDSHVSAGQ